MSRIEVRQSPTDQSVVVKFPPSWLHVVRGPVRDLDQVLGDYPSAMFAADGSMYNSAAGTDAFLWLDAAFNTRVPTKVPGEGMTISVVNGVATAAYGGVPASGASVAVQTWPSLVNQGVAVPHITAGNSERVWRIGMGVSRDGMIMVVMLVGSMLDLSNRMVREGMVNAGYLDGGSSLAAEARGVFRRAYTVPRGGSTHLIPGWILAIPPNGETPTVVSNTETQGTPVKQGSALPYVIGVGTLAALWMIFKED